ncbi:hypothetical protein L596_023004 [Steinernema carpocapsae]|uniref:Uncharacterized protein n=1 Tax=Steinernema carpocapsae TaxID=34508 RepID=A0A4U5MCB8_STECR|nr:hypothetical protein L596_023004 [Steinernema carpocapsae]
MIVSSQVISVALAAAIPLFVVVLFMFRDRLRDWRTRLIAFFSNPKKAAIAIIIGFPYTAVLPFINFPGRDYLVELVKSCWTGTSALDFDTAVNTTVTN